jgi:hypothetical protein
MAIEVGQKYKSENGIVGEILAIHGESIWMKWSREDFDDTFTTYKDHRVLQKYTLVEPFFEEGKSYRYKDGFSAVYIVKALLEIEGRRFAVTFDRAGLESVWNEKEFAQMEEAPKYS